MSASEKLRPLLETAPPVNQPGTGYIGYALVRVLPEIVALVKAAEDVRRSEGLEGREDGFMDSPFPTSKLAVALAALDEALSSE